VTGFVIVVAAALAAVLLWILFPLLRPRGAADSAQTRTERRISGAVIAIAVPALAIGMYAGLSDWDWEAREADAARMSDMEGLLRQLEAKLAENPRDVKGWTLLGNSYLRLQRYARAADAYQQAYDLTQGRDVEIVISLAEALAMTDEASLSGRAGELLERALASAPNHPKALWYGSIAALQKGDVRLGRDRLQTLLAQGPPPELRSALERQIQDLDQQLGEAAPSSGPQVPAAGAGGRTIRVAVTIAPQIQQQLREPAPLFILARDPAAAGPPLAVQRHNSSQAPLTVELKESDAMIASRTMASVPRVKVIARVSRSGSPQEQSGDFYGEAPYEFGKDSGIVNIMIDRTIP
jgi:cytochrome c-type biogenesis protein CcmH